MAWLSNYAFSRGRASRICRVSGEPEAAHPGHTASRLRRRQPRAGSALLGNRPRNSRAPERRWLGIRVIERLARDLRSAFPGMQGLSLRNLDYMKAFAEAWSDEQILQQVVAKLPWGHNVRLQDLVKGPEERLWYARRLRESLLI